MTNTSPFTPKSEDGVAQWEKVYTFFHALPYGYVAEYDEIERVTGIDVRANRQPIYRCMKEMEDNDQKTLQSVHGVGYQVANPQDHEALARRHHKSARRQVTKARRKARSANRNLLTSTEAAHIDAIEITLSRHEDLIRRLDGRVTNIEKAQKEARVVTEKKIGDVSSIAQRTVEALIRKGYLDHEDVHEPEPQPEAEPE